MRYINLHFTYLLYLLTLFAEKKRKQNLLDVTGQRPDEKQFEY